MEIKVGQKYRGMASGVIYNIMEIKRDKDTIIVEAPGESRKWSYRFFKQLVDEKLLVLMSDKPDLDKAREVFKESVTPAPRIGKVGALKEAAERSRGLLNQPVSERILNKLAEEGAKECEHEWIQYTGLNQSDDYTFCRKCEKEKV